MAKTKTDDKKDETKASAKTKADSKDKLSTKADDKKDETKASAKTKTEPKKETTTKAEAKTDNKKDDTDTSNNQIVETHDDGWAVRKEGSDRATEVFDTRVKAVTRARELAQSQGGEVFIYREGGPADA